MSEHETHQTKPDGAQAEPKETRKTVGQARYNTIEEQVLFDGVAACAGAAILFADVNPLANKHEIAAAAIGRAIAHAAIFHAGYPDMVKWELDKLRPDSLSCGLQGMLHRILGTPNKEAA